MDPVVVAVVKGASVSDILCVIYGIRTPPHGQ
jgi:hypothetical protein